LESRTLIKTLDHDSLHHNGLSIAFSPRGGYLVTSGGNGYDWTTKIWDFKTFDLVYKYPALFGANGDMDISYDSLFIILARSNKIFLLNSKWKSLGLEDKLDFNLRVLYPNPAGTSITIPLEQSRSAGKIILKNLEGITIKSINNIQPFINELILDISSIPAGTYFVLIDYLSKSITYKFEKIR